MKKGLLIASAVFLVLFGGLQLYIITHQPTPIEELRLRVAQLPKITLTGLDGSLFALESGKPLLLIYFNSDCEFCQRELQVIKKHIKSLDSFELVMMSSQSLEEIRTFSYELDFGGQENVRFGQIKPEVLAEVFGVLALPQIFLFSPDGSLFEIFTGETEPEEFLR